MSTIFKMQPKFKSAGAQPVTSWQTSDGRIHSIREDADRHQALLDFEEWYSGNAVRGAQPGEVLLWLDKNVEYLQGLLSALHRAKTI